VRQSRRSALGSPAVEAAATNKAFTGWVAYGV